MRWLLLAALLLLACDESVSGQERSPAAAAQVRAVPFTQVRLQDAFWNRRLETNRTVTLPAVLSRLEETRSVANFSCAAGQQEGQFSGEPYTDSDVFKWIEGASYALALAPDAELARQLERIIGAVSAAQQKDGYLHTFVTLKAPQDPWAKRDAHDTLYCNGHLIEACVSHYQTTRSPALLDVALKNADLLQQTFGPAAGQLKMPPGHPEIELALVRLAEVSGRRSYLDLARFFVDQRGHTAGRAGYGAYGQDHLPLVDEHEAVGHSVRAFYLYSAAADLAARLPKAPYRDVLQELFADVTSHKMFISGGVGLLRQGDAHESFTTAYHLPNDQPDVDTCSIIGLMFWLQRLNTLHPDGRYFDIFERALYNRLLAGLSLDGRRFFYGCPLESRGPKTFDAGPGATGDDAHSRPTWFRVPCCPTNLVRFLPTLGGYVYSRSDDAIWVNLFMGSSATFAMGEVNVTLTQQTEYPWHGRVSIEVSPDKPTEFDLLIRIPGWARGDEGCGNLYTSQLASEERQPAGTLPITLSVNGEPIKNLQITRNFARLRRTWRQGDRVVLDLPMPVRRTYADPSVANNVGSVVLQLDPLVYCLEDADHPPGVFQMALPADALLQVCWRGDLLGGVMTIEGTAQARTTTICEPARWRPVPLKAVPFSTWDNRQPGTMRVWIPQTSRTPK